MFSQKIQIYLNLIFIISIFSLISAYFIESILGHQPCNLCLIERIPYWLGIILVIINFTFKKHEKSIILLLLLIFIFSLIISIYHLGIEKNFFQESAICGLKDTGEIISKEDILRQLNEKTISCKDVTFKIFGFSLTAINIVISLFLTILLTKIFLNYEKFKK
jgi:disulfide bond formation protein DsbB|tara:strand:+ start:532 stop:1020 length:489 start_codon:yes stop_codon:yes gene_type:complete